MSGDLVKETTASASTKATKKKEHNLHAPRTLLLTYKNTNTELISFRGSLFTVIAVEAVYVSKFLSGKTSGN